MKRFFLFILAHIIIASYGWAQSPTVSYGYCDGNISDTRDFAVSGNADISAAILIPGNVLDGYAGNSIETIRVGIKSKINIDEITVWVRSSLDGENIVSQTINRETTQTVANGWNEIKLDTPYEIKKGAGDIYVGYTFSQRNMSYGISAITDIPKSLYVNNDGTWTDHSTEGSLSVEAVIGGDNVPALDMAPYFGSAPEFITSGNNVSVVAMMHNYGTSNINSYNINCKIEGEDEVYTFPVNEPLNSGASHQQTIRFTPELKHDLGDHRTILVYADNLDGNTDAVNSNDTLRLPVSVVSNVYSRRVFLEEFTGQLCGNCPRVAGFVHNILGKEDFANRLIVACHHAGYGKDTFTSEADEEYLVFYGSGGTYAPAAMIDRTEQNDGVPAFLPESQESLEELILNRLSVPAFYDLSLNVSKTDNTVTVDVDMERLSNEDNDLRYINVYLMEDGIIGYQSGTADEYNYEHNHVVRAYSSIWGEPIAWDGTKAAYSYTFDLNEKWNQDNMHVIAYISNYNPDNINACTIENAAEINLDGTTGIKAAIGEKAAEGDGATYNLAGQRVGKSWRGIVIRNGKKYMAR